MGNVSTRQSEDGRVDQLDVHLNRNSDSEKQLEKQLKSMAVEHKKMMNKIKK